MTKRKLTKIGFTLFTILVTTSLIFTYFFVSKKMKDMGLKVTLPELINFTIKNRDYLLGKEELLAYEGEKDPELIKEIAQLEKDSTEKYTNFLIVGIDTRGSTSGLQNTDTIIVANYNHESNKLILFSVPRDLYGIITTSSSSSPRYNKINSAYAYGEGRKSGSGMETLRLTVEKTLDIEIQYSVVVNYTAFEEIIDLLGGIEIDVENSFTDYRYPGPNSGFVTVKFTKGVQTMDGKTALQYARSRKSMQAGEGSDFARARRQQKVLEAVATKALNTDMFSSPTSIIKLLDSMSKNIKLSDYTLTDLEAALALTDKLEDVEITNLVLDPSIGNYTVLTTGVGNGYTIGPKKGTRNYSDFHAFIAKSIEYPELYAEPIKVFVYDTGAGATNARELSNELKEQFPFIDVRYWGLLRGLETDGVVIFKYNEVTNDQAFSYVEDFLGDQVSSTRPENLPTLKNEDITILVGKESTSIDE